MRPSYRPAIPPTPQQYRTQVLDHLGLVAGMFEGKSLSEKVTLWLRDASPSGGSWRS